MLLGAFLKRLIHPCVMGKRWSFHCPLLGLGTVLGTVAVILPSQFLDDQYIGRELKRRKTSLEAALIL